MQKKVLGIVVCVVMLTTLLFPAYAVETTNHEKLMKVAIDLGYSEESAGLLSDSELEELMEAVRDNNEVDISSTVLAVDTIEEIREFVECDEAEMIESGGDVEEIEKAQEVVDELFDMTDRELKKECGFTTPEIKALHEIEEGVEEQCENKECDVEASGTLSQSVCEVTVAKFDKSTKKRPVQYKINASFTWHKVPFWCFTDEFSLAWGGDLNLDDDSVDTTVFFYELEDDGFGNECKIYTLKESEIHEKIQTGCTFDIRMSKYEGKVAKSGKVNLVIYQTKKEGKETKLHVKYGHKIACIKGSVSLSKAPSITFAPTAKFNSTNPPIKKVLKY